MPANPQSDSGYLAELQAGNESSLGLLLQARKPDLEARIKRMINKSWIRSRVCPSDIVQKAFVKAIECHSQFRGSTSDEWDQWLRLITLRELMLEYRESRFRFLPLHRILPGRTTETSMDFVDSTTSVWVKANRKELEELLGQIISDFSSRDQQIFNLRNLELLDWRTVGDKVGCSGDAARTRYTREILPRLATRLEFLFLPA